jgi:hypothetical protein
LVKHISDEDAGIVELARNGDKWQEPKAVVSISTEGQENPAVAVSRNNTSSVSNTISVFYQPRPKIIDLTPANTKNATSKIESEALKPRGIPTARGSPFPISMESIPGVGTGNTSISGNATQGTAFSAPVKPATGSFSGLAYAVQKHSFRNNNHVGCGPYPDLNIEFFKSNKPVQQDITKKFGYSFFTSQYRGSIYGGETIQIDYMATNYRGYIYAKTSGTYTFTVSRSDDITLLWLDDDAYTSYTRSNAFLTANWEDRNVVRKKHLLAGTYTPIRILAINGQEGAYFAIQITDPNDKILLSDIVTDQSDAIIPFSRYKPKTAPPFPPFGEEVEVKGANGPGRFGAAFKTWKQVDEYLEMLMPQTVGLF